MKLLNFKSGWIGISYFYILLSIALLVTDIPTQYDASTTAEDIIRTSVLGDPKWFATTAVDIATNGSVSSSNNWVLNLWPPGFVFLEALIIKIFGLEAPIILILQILAAGLFAGVLTLLYRLLRENLNESISFILPLTIFAFPTSRVFLLQPVGLSFGESFAIGFFLIGLLLSLRSVQWHNLGLAIYAGICFALAAYFRSQFEIILLAMTVCGLLPIVFARLKPFIKFRTRSQTSAAKIILVTLLVAHAAMLPWRIYHWANNGSLAWVYTSSVTFGNSVATTEHLESVGGGFVVAGRGNLTCRIDPATCGDKVNAKRLFIKTFLSHPVQWYSLKLEVLGEYWFSPTENWTAVSVAATPMSYVINTFFLIAIVAAILLLLVRKVRLHISWPVLAWLSLSLLSAYGLIFTVQQFEVRYFYFPKIIGVVLFFIVVSMCCCREEERKV
jgi:hypothetical protein